MTPAAFLITLAVVFAFCTVIAIVADELDRRERKRHRAQCRRNLRKLDW